MKSLKKISLLLLISASLSLTGCEELLSQLGLDGGVKTISQRISAFETSVNKSTRTAEELRAHFGPKDQMAYYNSAGSIAYWNSAFPYNYRFTISDQSDSSAVVVAVKKISTSGATISEPTYTFKMHRESSGNYLITEIKSSEQEEALIRSVDF